MTDLGELISLPVADIALPDERSTPISSAAVAAFASLLTTTGQLQPITVMRRPGGKPPYLVVDGAKRLVAAKAAGFETIAAIVETKRDASPAARRERQVSVNLDRGDRHALAFAMLVGARAETVLDRDKRPDETPHQRAIRIRWERKNPSKGPAKDTSPETGHVSWQASTIALTGCSRTQLFAHLAVYRGVAQRFPEHVDRLLDNPHTDHLGGLTVIAKLPYPLALRVVETLIDRHDLTIKQALVEADAHASNGHREPTEQNRRAASFNRLWDAMSTIEQTSIALTVARKAKPSIKEQLARDLIAQGYGSSSK